MFGLRPSYENILMQEDNPYGGGGSGGATTATTDMDVPFEVQTRLARESTSAEDYRRRIEEWKQQQVAIQQISAAVIPGWIQIDETHWYNPGNGRVQEIGRYADGGIKFTEYSAADSAAYLNSIGVPGSSPSGPSGSGGGGGGGGIDPQALALQYAELAAQLKNMGLDAESSRLQQLAGLIANRNNTAVDVANTSLNAAKVLSDAMANPRDAVAELFLRNQVGGNVPFGDLTNEHFGEYGKALGEKVANIANMFGQDINQARLYRDAIPPAEFYGAETRAKLGLGPTPAQQLTGAGATSPAVAPAPTNPLQALTDRLKAMSPEDQTNFRRYVTGNPAAMAKGGKLNFDSMFDRSSDGYSPSSSEGGTNLDIHERAIVLGESGHVYATLGERRPDGTMRAEQLQIKPLKSEVEKDKKLAEGNKAVVENQSKTMAAFAQGGTVNATPDDFMEQLRKYLGSLGSPGAGTGDFSTPLPSPRLLAGDPYNQLLQDPDALAYTQAGFSALGISPASLQATIKRYTPESPINNSPRVSYI